MNGVTYDTGALIAADHNDRRMWALHAGFLAEEVSPTVPTPVEIRPIDASGLEDLFFELTAVDPESRPR